MHLTDRAPYQALPDRPALQGLDGARLLVWVIVNVEHWRIDGPMPRTVLSPPMGQPLQPDKTEILAFISHPIRLTLV